MTVLQLQAAVQGHYGTRAVVTFKSTAQLTVFLASGVQSAVRFLREDGQPIEIDPEQVASITIED